MVQKIVFVKSGAPNQYLVQNQNVESTEIVSHVLGTQTTDTQCRHKSKISEKLSLCGRQNMLRPYLKFGSGSEFLAVQ